MAPDRLRPIEGRHLSLEEASQEFHKLIGLFGKGFREFTFDAIDHLDYGIRTPKHFPEKGQIGLILVGRRELEIDFESLNPNAGVQGWRLIARQSNPQSTKPNDFWQVTWHFDQNGKETHHSVIKARTLKGISELSHIPTLTYQKAIAPS